MLASGIGFCVFAYAARYLPRDLAGRPDSLAEQRRFWGFMVLFLVAMVGLATAQDLLAIFVFWDLTAIASYMLIGLKRDSASARAGALMALLVTGVTAVLLLVGALVLFAEYGTFSLPELFDRAGPGTAVTLGTALLCIAALAKSAQVPFHFWLPRAMTAPTPVSAYLHSAAMVAAGVLLIGRILPLIELSELVQTALVIVGLTTIVVGGALALLRDPLKQILAYSTISQYGYIVTAYGLGGKAGSSAAGLFVIAHAIAKSSLFMVAGTVMQQLGGEDRLSRLSGMAGRMPLTAVLAFVACAGLAALPLTLGFFKDELLFKAALEHSPAMAIALAAGAGLTLAYMARFWGGIFLAPGDPDAPPIVRRIATVLRDAVWAPVAPALMAPTALLVMALIVGGVWPDPFVALADDATFASLGTPADTPAAYHLDARAENLLALGAFATAAVILGTRMLWEARLAALYRAAGRIGPERAYAWTVGALNRLSNAAHDFEVRDLRTRITAVLVPCGILLAAGLVATPLEGSYRLGAVGPRDTVLVVALALTGLTAVATTRPRRHVTMVVLLSATGYSLAVVYAFFGAPDVALVAVLVETLFSLLFLGVFALLPSEVLRRKQQYHDIRVRRIRDPLIATGAGLFAFLVVWSALSGPSPEQVDRGADLLRRSPDAHADDAVTGILSDFRALDTLGEVTVLVVAVIAVLSLLARRRSA
ncbi:MAG: hydrogen gas-evolving membrane-bound hydrogenase subunit E [Solirubrobacterales bacterium]